MDDAGTVCSTCKQWQPLTEYNRRSQAPDGLQSRCRACNGAWYAANKARHVANVRQRNDRVRLEYQQRIADHLARHPCVDCGEADLRVLEFDHTDPRTELGTIGRLVASSLEWGRIQAEIDKCQVRCSNCHRVRTMTDCGSYRVEAERRRLAEVERVLDDLQREVWRDA